MLLFLALQTTTPAPASPPQTATVVVAYAVTAEGRIEDCTIAQSSGQPALDATACRVLTEKARFTPERRPDGKPVRAARREQRITFAITE